MALQLPLGTTVGLSRAPGQLTGGNVLDEESVAAPEEFKSAVPQFSDNPIGAIGFVLSETGQGLRGQPSRVPELKAQDERSKMLAIQKQMMGLEISQQFIQDYRDIPIADTERQQAVIADYGTRFGDFGIDFAGMADDPESAAQAVQSFNGINPELLANMTFQQQRDLAGDPVRMAAYQEVSDRMSVNAGLAAIERAMDLAETDPQAAAVLDRVKRNGITMSEIEEIAPMIGMQAWEVSALRANQDELFPQLSNQFGVEFVSTRALGMHEQARINAQYRAPRAPTTYDRVRAFYAGLTDEEGNPVYSPGEVEGLALGIIPSPFAAGSDTERDRQISDIMARNPEMSREDAAAIADGRLRTSLNPQDGTAVTIDQDTQEATIVAFDAPQRGTGEVAGESSIPEDFSLEGATGGLGAVTNISNAIADMVGAGEVDPANTATTQYLNNLRVRTTTTLQSAIPGRPSNYLMDQLDQLAVTPNELFQGPERARERLAQTQALINNEIARMNQLLEEGGFSPTNTQEIRANLSQLQGLQRDYEAVMQAVDRGMTSAEQAATRPDTLPAPSGSAAPASVPGDPGTTRETLSGLLRTLPTEEVIRLSPFLQTLDEQTQIQVIERYMRMNEAQRDAFIAAGEGGG